jgi:HK97 family phage prohead protease
MSKIETRTISLELRAGPAFEVAGRAASYNHLSNDLGGFVERLQPGCFKRSLAAGTDVKCLVNHDSNQILGRLANKTLSLEDTNDGLNFRCKLNPDSQAHRDLYASVKRGDLSECSFAFGVDDGGDDFDSIVDPNFAGRSIKRRTIRSAKLFDVSVVASPAYGNGATQVNARSTANYARPQSDQTAILAQIVAFNKRTAASTETAPTRRHGEIASRYKYLDWSQIRRAVHFNYDEDTLNALNLAELTKRIH